VRKREWFGLPAEPWLRMPTAIEEHKHYSDTVAVGDGEKLVASPKKPLAIL
jgi:hypothetical protein